MQAPVFKRGFLAGYYPFMITSLFGEKRPNSIHKGVDVGCPSGTILQAPISGVIQKIGFEKGGFGLYLVIRYMIMTDDYIDVYLAHLSEVSSTLVLNQKINAGDYIAKTGGIKGAKNSGHSTGAHLHLEIRHINTPIEPRPFFMLNNSIVQKTKSVFQSGVVDPHIKQWFVWEVDFISISEKMSGVIPDSTIANATESDIVVTPKNTIAQERNAAGIWSIIKLIMDSSVVNKQVVDSSIASQQGSLLNFFHKVCQSPMVEFFGDTYGDQFYFIVRKPPFDKKGFSDMMDLAMIEINSADVISTSLDWNNSGIYSWYQYMPKAQLLVGDFDLSALVPAVFFPEYASIWGSKPLCVESNYFTWIASGKYNSDKKENKTNDDNTIAAAFEDLRYIIECNAYAPFTRSGVIVTKGDRRYKKGTLVQHTSGEVFYIEKVDNEYSVSTNGVARKTTLTVSRGMYPEFIKGITVDGSKEIYSYFNLIDFGGSSEKITSDNWKKVMSKWHVNKTVFGFFMSKGQLIQRQMLKKK